MSKYIVTGGAGFIGSNIVEELVKRGEEVKIIDDLSAGSKANIRPVLDKIELVQDSITNYSCLKREFPGYDYVIHQAADVSVQASIEDPIGTTKTNVLGTVNVLSAAKDAGIRRVVIASSCAVYGEQQSAISENATLKPMSPYAVSKLSAENYAKLFADAYGIETVCLRYFNVFGPKQNPSSEYAAVIPKFIKLIKAGRKPTIYGDGFQTRDFVYVSNVVEANLLACSAAGVSGKAYNIGSGISTDINTLVKHVNKVLDKNMAPKYEPARAGDIVHSRASINAAKHDLGYFPKIDLMAGLSKMAESL